jgi:uncharacterized protein (TIGR02147 family)
MKVFDFDDYKTFTRKKIQTLEGKGQYSRIAEFLNIHTSMVSQIFSGPKHLTFEQACGICKFFAFTDLETDYFIALVQLERAGTQEAREKCSRDLAKIKAQSESLKDRLTKDIVLTDEDNALFYSQWFYTAIKLLTSIPGFQTAEAIAKGLNVPLHVVNTALEFLISKGLCVEGEGKVKPGPANTHLGAESPFVARHHQNWRLKGFERMISVKPAELFLTMPATLRERDAQILRQKIVSFIEEFVGVIDSSKGEVLYCLNLDWFSL